MATGQVKWVTYPDVPLGAFLVVVLSGSGWFGFCLHATLRHIHDFGGRHLKTKNQLNCEFELSYMQNIHII